MQNKSIEQIKEEVAKESTYETWDSLKWHIGISDTMLDKVATRYTSQFQAKNTELEDTIRELATQLELKVGHETNLIAHARGLIKKIK